MFVIVILYNQIIIITIIIIVNNEVLSPKVHRLRTKLQLWRTNQDRETAAKQKRHRPLLKKVGRDGA